MKIKNVNIVETGTGEITKEYAEQTFKELLAFQGYGFCVGYDTEVIERLKGIMPIGKLAVDDHILSPGTADGEKWVRVCNILPQGIKQLYQVNLVNGKFLKCTLDHKFLCDDGYLRKPMSAIEESKMIACRVKGGNGPNLSRIKEIVYLGEYPVMDITVECKSHLFYANEIIVSNCKAHAVSYSVYSAVQMWLQEHYFLQYMCVLLTHIDRAKEKKGHLILNERVQYCAKFGIPVHYPDVNTSTDKWEIMTGGGLLAPLKNIKGFSDRDVNIIVSNRPYNDLKDFLDKTGIKERKFETLLFAHAFDCWNKDMEYIYNWYYNHYYNDKKKPKKIPVTTDLFDLDGEEEASSQSETLVHFTSSELEDKCLDINGFVIYENILIKYKDYYGKTIKEIREGENADPSNLSNIISIEAVKSVDIDEVKKTKKGGMERWTIGEVKSISKVIKTKNNYDMQKVLVSDGIANLELAFFNMALPYYFKKGNVVIFPVWISYWEDRGELSVKFSVFGAEKNEPYVIYEAK